MWPVEQYVTHQSCSLAYTRDFWYRIYKNIFPSNFLFHSWVAKSVFSYSISRKPSLKHYARVSINGAIFIKEELQNECNSIKFLHRCLSETWSKTFLGERHTGTVQCLSSPREMITCTSMNRELHSSSTRGLVAARERNILGGWAWGISLPLLVGPFFSLRKMHQSQKSKGVHWIPNRKLVDRSQRLSACNEAGELSPIQEEEKCIKKNSFSSTGIILSCYHQVFLRSRSLLHTAVQRFTITGPFMGP